MLFDEKFIDAVEDEPILGIIEACERVDRALEEASTDPGHWNEVEHEILWEGASFIHTVLDQTGIHVPVEYPEATGDIHTNSTNLKEYIASVNLYFQEQSVLLKIQSYTGRYKASLKSSFAYEFSQGDLERIQTLIDELRLEISEQKYLEQGHKQRLLKRLEKLQSELHKRVSDLDRFWGLIGDAGVVLGKLGEDAKPIVDRTREIAEIIWKTQARSEELPSDTENPMLEHDEKS